MNWKNRYNQLKGETIDHTICDEATDYSIGVDFGEGVDLPDLPPERTYRTMRTADGRIVRVETIGPGGDTRWRIEG